MEVFKKYGLAESKFYKLVSDHLGLEKIDALKLGHFNGLDGTNDSFMSNIQKLDIKAFSETEVNRQLPIPMFSSQKIDQLHYFCKV